MGALLPLLLASAGAAGAPWVWLAVGSDSPDCRARIDTAIAQRRPGVPLHNGQSNDPADVSALLEQSNGRWSLAIRSGSLPPLIRLLPEQEHECKETAETVALMLDRYLDDIHWSGGGVAIGTTDKTTRPEHPGTVENPYYLLPARRVELAVELGPAIGSSPAGAWPFAVGGVGMRIGRWEVSAEGQATGPAKPLIDAASSAVGSYSVESGSVALAAGYRLPVGPGAIRFDVVPGVEFLSVTVSGSQLFHEQASFGSAPFIGARVGYSWSLPWRLELSARLDGHLVLRPVEFGVEGYPGGVATPTWGGDLAVTLARTFF